MRRSLFIIAIAFLIGCASPPPEVDPDYRAEIEAWRASRLERLTAEDGWLTLVGLHWIEPGISRFGADANNEIPIAVNGVPGFAGTVEVGEDGTIALRASGDGEVTVNGEVTVESLLSTDVGGRPDVVGTGRANFHIINRNGKLAARVKDPDAPSRRSFEGIDYFAIDDNYRVTARLEQYPIPKEVKIPTVVGTPTIMLAPGLLHFRVNGEDLTLEPYVGTPESATYFLIFRDRTSGDSTYGAGRFLSASAVGDESTTVLDFNLAYNPPCAFTPYATCPLPTPQNSLSIPIEAGEKYSKDH